MLRFGAILAMCLMVVGCDNTAKEQVDFEHIVSVMGDRSVRAERNIRALSSTRATATNLISVVASIQSVPRDKGQSREEVWVPWLESNLVSRTDGKLLVKGVANSVVRSVSPIIAYLDKMEKEHPDWDVKQLEDAYFKHLSECVK